MAKEYELTIHGQPTKYSNHSREFSIYFAEPDRGIHDGIRILLLLSGYGGSASSKVYQKMRRIFADEYDVVTLQCDYLGYRHMQNDHHIPITEEVLRSALSPREFRDIRKDFAGNKEILRGKVLSGFVPLGENEDDFNEMGLWQAMDHLMALKILMDIMESNQVEIHRHSVIAYGQSHGAYLAYLCNRLAPEMFYALIDNSAYLLPYYLHADREVTKEGELFSLRKLYHYIVADQEIDEGSYDLKKLYQGYKGHTKMIVFHGKDDTMIPINEKKRFLSQFEEICVHEIGKEQIDGRVFQSSGHSLGADLLEMFRMAMKDLEMFSDKKPKERISYVDRFFETDQYSYQIGWKHGIPLLDWCRKDEGMNI